MFNLQTTYYYTSRTNSDSATMTTNNEHKDLSDIYKGLWLSEKSDTSVYVEASFHNWLVCKLTG